MESIRQTNIQLCQMGMGMPVFAKMKEILNGGTYNSRVLELNGLRENPFVPSSTTTKELINIDRDKEAEKKAEEERLREGEEIYKNKWKRLFSLILNTSKFLLIIFIR